MMKFRGKLAAAIMAGTMAVSMMGISAMADGTEAAKPTATSSTEITLTKNVITHSADVKAPATDFTFKIESGKAGTFQKQDVYAGVDDGLKVTKESVSFNADMVYNKTVEGYTNTDTLTTDINKFENNGIYHYVVTENSGSYEGMTYTDKSYDVYVYVETNDGVKSVSYVVTNTNGDATAAVKSNLVFDNTYTTKKVSAKKEITGNQSVASDLFEFEITVNGAEGEKYTLNYTQENGKPATPIVLETGKTQKIEKISNNDTIEVVGLSDTDSYTIKELENSRQYVVTVDGEKTDKATGTAAAYTKQRVFLNTKSTNAPTGIVLNYAPYMLIAGLAVVFAVMFLRRREQEEI